MRLKRRHDLTYLCMHCLHGGTAIAPQFSVEEIRSLNPVGPLVNRRDTDITQILGRTRLLDIAHTTVDLNPQRSHFNSNFGQPALYHRYHQVDSTLTDLASRFSARVSQIHRDRL